MAVLPQLEILYLARNHIGDGGLAAIAESLAHSTMWQLVLTENRVGDAGLKALATAVGKDNSAFSALRWLFLDQNPITDDGVEALCLALGVGLKNIERLALHKCELTNAGLAHLAKAIDGGALPKCEYLYVQENGFDREGRQILKAAAKPRNIKVHFGWPPPLPGVEYD